jgi:hypothetical protein
MEFTTRLGLHSQATRLENNGSNVTADPMSNGIFTLSDAIFQSTSIGTATEARVYTPQFVA